MKTVPIMVIMELCRKGGTNLYPINRETLVFISKARFGQSGVKSA